MATDEILIVHSVIRDGNDLLVTCPHCMETVYVDRPYKGEQFQHLPRCGGWFEISYDPRMFKFK